MTCPKPCSRYRLPTSKLCTKLPLETWKQRTACLSHLPAIYATVRDKEHSHLWLLAIWSPLILSRGTPCLVNAISSEWLDPKRLHILCLGKADSTCCKLKHVSSVLYIKSQRGGCSSYPQLCGNNPEGISLAGSECTLLTQERRDRERELGQALVQKDLCFCWNSSTEEPQYWLSTMKVQP